MRGRLIAVDVHGWGKLAAGVWPTSRDTAWIVDSSTTNARYSF